MMNWQSSASIETLKKRAEITQQIRKFFLTKDLLEVETPILAAFANPDPNLHSFYTLDKVKMYLQTSPEFHMKRLLASNSGDIFQISKAFRKDELGKKHNPEFTMLEWYRVGMNYHALMQEVYELISLFLSIPMQKITYQELFLQTINLDPFTVTIEECQKLASKYNIQIHESFNLSLDEWLDVFLTQLVEIKMSKAAVFVYDYKSTKAALAKIRDDKIAERFELYIDGIEIANGFAELTDPKEQYTRFQKDCKKRQSGNLEDIAIDHNFIEALHHMPECSGVALGIDRLIMLILEKSDLKDVLAFPKDRA